MIADALAYAGPIRQILDLLSTEELVPEPARDVMRPVSEGLEVAGRLGPPLEGLLSESWDSMAALGASRSLADIGRTVGVLTDSAVEITRVTAVAAEIVVRGTIEVLAVVHQFAARAAALGPTLVTPPGQAALLGLAVEHLSRGLQVVERVQSELVAPTAELRSIAVTIPDAPLPPGLPGAGAGVGAVGAMSSSRGGGVVDAGTIADTGSGPRALADGIAVAAEDENPDPSGDPSPAAQGGAGSGMVGGGIEVALPDGSVATAPNEQAATAVRSALSQQGVPYVWGGTTPGQGLDCSGLTQWAYGESGVEIPRLAQEQDVGVQIPQSDLMPGDLAVWDGHVAMYIGNGQLVEAGDPVAVSGLRTDNIGMSFHGFYRPTGG